jgi:hypothetical protein
MKKALLAVLFGTVISSWCLAQTDSLPAPTAEPCQPATCSEPCQPGACDIPCQPAPCADPFVPKWAVGTSFTRLIDAPGAFVFERLYSKSSLEYRLSMSIGGGLLLQDGNVNSWIEDEILRLGVNYKKLIAGDNNILKLYFGFGPAISYGRRYDYQSANNKFESNKYGADFVFFVKASIVKDILVKNIRIRNEFDFKPAQANIFFWYEKSWLEGEGTTEITYGNYKLSAASSGSVSYSIKYLF